MGLRAELEGAQTQLSMTIQQVETLQRRAERSRELQEELDAAQLEALHARDAMDSMNRSSGAPAPSWTTRGASSGRFAVRSSGRPSSPTICARRRRKWRAARLAPGRARRAGGGAGGPGPRAPRGVPDAIGRVGDPACGGARQDRRRSTRIAVTAAKGAEEASARSRRRRRPRSAWSESEARVVDLESALARARDGARPYRAAAAGVVRAPECLRRRRERGPSGTGGSPRARRGDREARGSAGQGGGGGRIGARDPGCARSSDALTQEETARLAEQADRLAAELEAAAQANTEMNRRLQEIEARRRWRSPRTKVARTSTSC